MTGYISSARSIILLGCSIITTLAVALRIWARRIRRTSLELNDYLIVLGLAFALAEVVMFIYCDPWMPKLSTWEELTATLNAQVAHKTEEREKAIAIVFKAGRPCPIQRLKTDIPQTNFMSQIMWAMAVGCIRSSIVLLYVRIFPTRRFRLICYAIIALNCAFSIGYILADCLICNPIKCEWDIRTPCVSCGDATLYQAFNGSISLAFDVTVVLLPTPVLWRLQMAVSKKVIISLMFGLGILICVLTAYRLRQVWASGFVLAAVDFLMALEAILGVLNACLPVLRPVFDKVRDWLESLARRDSTGASSIYGSIPILLQVSQMWQSRSRQRAGREELDSITEMEDWRTFQDRIQTTHGGVKAMEVKENQIHMQRDVRVENA